MKVKNAILIKDDMMIKIRKGLDDSTMFQTGGWRHYIYSKEDPLVKWENH